MKVKKESGRTIVETLGVVAVAGVLTIGGIGGYTYAMNKHRTNELLNEASKRAYTVYEQLGVKEVDLSSFEGKNRTAGGVFSNAVDTTTLSKRFALKVSDVPEGVCENLFSSIGERSLLKSVRRDSEGLPDMTAEECDDRNALALIFNMDLTSDAVEEEEPESVDYECGGGQLYKRGNIDNSSYRTAVTSCYCIGASGSYDSDEEAIGAMCGRSVSYWCYSGYKIILYDGREDVTYCNCSNGAGGAYYSQQEAINGLCFSSNPVNYHCYSGYAVVDEYGAYVAWCDCDNGPGSKSGEYSTVEAAVEAICDSPSAPAPYYCYSGYELRVYDNDNSRVKTVSYCKCSNGDGGSYYSDSDAINNMCDTSSWYDTSSYDTSSGASNLRFYYCYSGYALQENYSGLVVWCNCHDGASGEYPSVSEAEMAMCEASSGEDYYNCVGDTIYKGETPVSQCAGGCMGTGYYIGGNGYYPSDFAAIHAMCRDYVDLKRNYYCSGNHLYMQESSDPVYECRCPDGVSANVSYYAARAYMCANESGNNYYYCDDNHDIRITMSDWAKPFVYHCEGECQTGWGAYSSKDEAVLAMCGTSLGPDTSSGGYYYECHDNKVSIIQDGEVVSAWGDCNCEDGARSWEDPSYSLCQEGNEVGEFCPCVSGLICQDNRCALPTGDEFTYGYYCGSNGSYVYEYQVSGSVYNVGWCPGGCEVGATRTFEQSWTGLCNSIRYECNAGGTALLQGGRSIKTCYCTGSPADYSSDSEAIAAMCDDRYRCNAGGTSILKGNRSIKTCYCTGSPADYSSDSEAIAAMCDDRYRCNAEGTKLYKGNTNITACKCEGEPADYSTKEEAIAAMCSYELYQCNTAGTAILKGSTSVKSCKCMGEPADYRTKEEAIAAMCDERYQCNAAGTALLKGNTNITTCQCAGEPADYSTKEEAIAAMCSYQAYKCNAEGTKLLKGDNSTVESCICVGAPGNYRTNAEASDGMCDKRYRCNAEGTALYKGMSYVQSCYCTGSPSESMSGMCDNRYHCSAAGTVLLKGLDAIAECGCTGSPANYNSSSEAVAAMCSTPVTAAWTEWFDVDYPKYEEGGGDFETYEKIRAAGGKVCSNPTSIQCEAENYPGLSVEQVGQRVHCDVRFGLVCRNEEQPGLFKMCINYRVRVLCPQE